MGSMGGNDRNNDQGGRQRPGRRPATRAAAPTTRVVAALAALALLASGSAPRYARGAMSADLEPAYLLAVVRAAAAARSVLEWMESATERLAPGRLDELVDHARAAHQRPLQEAGRMLAAANPPREMTGFAKHFRATFDHVSAAFENFTAAPSQPFMARIAPLLGAMHHLARAQEGFYVVRHALAPLRGFWDLPGCEVGEPEQPFKSEVATAGLTHMSRGGHHGGFSLYVPETYTPEREWPLIVALHGGSGNGRDFLWTWLREARSLGYLLIAPKSYGDTWSEIDDHGLLEILGWIERYYRLDRRRILLTGLSDGGTYALLYGLAHRDVYRAIAPLCGVLHPANGVIGNLERAQGAPIYLVHGGQDFLFPVHLARFARDTLLGAGAALLYREIDELSHTYPRSENVAILRWFAGI